MAWTRRPASAQRLPVAVDPSTPVVVLGAHHGSLGIARSLGRLGVPVYGIDGDARAPAFSSRYFRSVIAWDCESAPADVTIALLEKLSRRIGRRALLIPTTDASSLLVAEHADALAVHFVFPRVPPDVVRAFSDKRALFHLATRLGIPTPAAVFPQSLAEVRSYFGRAVYPVMLKGIDGTRLQARTGRKMAIVQSEEELLERYRALEDPELPNLMLQEYIPGGDDTIWMFNGYFSATSECLAGFTGKKLRQHPVHTGATSLGTCLSNATVAAQAVAFMKAVGYRGILDIGFRYDGRDGLYKLLDPNPRIGSTFRLFVDANGIDVVRLLYLDMTGQALPPAGVPREGRKWIVEDQDLEASLDYRREGELTVRQWLQSLRGIDETAWFAGDDLVPSWRAAARFARRAGAWLARRALALARHLWDRPGPRSRDPAVAPGR